ncbi:hypothetical protein PUMCH_000190 [Australozyma saopauloensis]|uniref:Phosphatidylinositol-specific phospholipase C X domain-containing protein n=1 Tax=Australozyma saopauloensis TaxID=291208 RepID=A0AAX4H356_9ASCO|nr:hypothetical protein PUMCH_000190 [[Candida] saopauloensis]
MVNQNSWMSEISDDVCLSSLSIPGTHNSGACYKTLPSVRCQNEPVYNQLVNGVRFLDIRVGKHHLKSRDDDAELTVVHGKFPVRIPIARKFIKVLTEIYDFLGENPSEAVLLSLKVEGVGDWDTQNDEFAQLLWNRYIQPNEHKWHFNSELPRLGDARGRIVLMRRFKLTDQTLIPRFGFDASYWSYNTIEDDRGLFVVQDKCELRNKEEIEQKVGFVKNLMQKAVDHNSSQDANKLFLNFTSGTNLINKDCWPDRVARAVANTDISSFFKKGCGVVILDFIDLDNWGLARSLVDSNFQN